MHDSTSGRSRGVITGPCALTSARDVKVKKRLTKSELMLMRRAQHQLNFIRRLYRSISSDFSENSLFMYASHAYGWTKLRQLIRPGHYVLSRVRISRKKEESLPGLAWKYLCCGFDCVVRTLLTRASGVNSKR